MTAALVEVESLSRSFDVSPPWLDRALTGLPRQTLRAVIDVSFAIGRGETFALVGESGSGKSTIARLVLGLLPRDAGRVVIDGIALDGNGRGRRAVRRRVQMIFQDPFASLNPRMRVARIVAEPIHALGLARGRAARERVDALLEAVGLDRRDGARFPHEFSGGQRQRISIARALACEPAFLVCDEPTSALDVSIQAQILNLMRDVQEARGLTYLFISHDLSVVRHMADRVGVLHLGRLVEVAPARVLFAAPRHPYTRLLLAAVPDIARAGRGRAPVIGEMPNPIDPPSGCTFHPRCPLADRRCRQAVPRPLPAGPTLVACHAVEEGRAGY